MTLNAYTLDITDMEMVPLRAAVAAYMKTCRAEIAAGNKTPHEPHLKRLEKMMSDLSARGSVATQSTRARDGEPGRIMLGPQLFESDDDHGD